MQEKNFYKAIVKNTGLFGISQLIKVFVRIFSNKVAAIFLGPIGIGILGLLENVLQLISSTTSFGIPESSVREIAILEQANDTRKSKRLVKIIYKWAMASGFVGLIICTLFSSRINAVVFENEISQVWIILLSLYFLFSSITNIRMAVLKAKRKTILIVKYNICSAITSASIAAIGYYFLRISGVIPVVLLMALFNFLLSLYFTKEEKVSNGALSLKQVYNEGLPMAKLGVLLSVSVIFGQLCFYIIRLFLKSNYSFEVLGIYQVSNTVLVGYLGMVFSAMTNDFYPRLCNYENDKSNFNNLINDQTEFALLIVVPSILLLYLIAPKLIELFYSREFLDVLSVLKVGLIAVVLKSIIWPIGFIPLVKGEKRIFLIQNLIGDTAYLFASIGFFYYFGLLGLGLAMVFMFIVSGLYNYYVAIQFYNIKFRKKTVNVIFISMLISVLAMVIVLSSGFTTFNYKILALLLISIFYSLSRLKKSIYQ